MDVLERLLQQDFSFRNFPAYPRHLGVEKYNCVALLEMTPEGQWRQFGAEGYLLEEQIALLVERQGQPWFVFKSKELLAEGEPLESYRRFQQELRGAMQQE
ncbi:MAG: hypothetical protein A3H27_10220 [Acidobacteria bacterium RIFCSPLOWO2_02_FULL_59_13]|nr:MAG: hypothetical protein A3H27_10220 [Acidobacteria bacterium RIFCSPLOWO2_02_FULL_59_13]